MKNMNKISKLKCMLKGKISCLLAPVKWLDCSCELFAMVVSGAGDAVLTPSDSAALSIVMVISDHPSPVSPLSCPCTGCVSQSEASVRRQ